MNCKWCGDQLVGKRRDAEYCDSSCRASASEERQERPEWSKQALRSADAPAPHKLAVAPDSTKQRWADLIRYSILAAAAQHSHYQVHADDIRDLGVPPAIRQGLNGKVFRALATKGLLRSTEEWRASRVPSRHGNRSLVYTITADGLAAYRSMPEPPELQEALKLVPDSIGAEAPKSHIRDSEAA